MCRKSACHATGISWPGRPAADPLLQPAPDPFGNCIVSVWLRTVHTLLLRSIAIWIRWLCALTLFTGRSCPFSTVQSSLRISFGKAQYFYNLCISGVRFSYSLWYNNEKYYKRLFVLYFVAVWFGRKGSLYVLFMQTVWIDSGEMHIDMLLYVPGKMLIN